MTYPFSHFPGFAPAIAQASAESTPTLWFIFRGKHLLMSSGELGPGIPCSSLPPVADDLITYHRTIGALGPLPCAAVSLVTDPAEVPGLEPVPLRQALALLGEEHFAAASRAAQVLTWHDQHRFCSRCATPLEEQTGELLKTCPRCSLQAFPRISPAVIMAVRHGEKLLLGRARHFPAGMYSTLAGFVEPGETLEDAVQREVMEEAGIEVADIRYLASQPWPFPHSLMIGFVCRYLSGALSVNTDELEDAAWFPATSLPTLPPVGTVARLLIEHALKEAAAS